MTSEIFRTGHPKSLLLLQNQVEELQKALEESESSKKRMIEVYSTAKVKKKKKEKKDEEPLNVNVDSSRIDIMRKLREIQRELRTSEDKHRLEIAQVTDEKDSEIRLLTRKLKKMEAEHAEQLETQMDTMNLKFANELKCVTEEIEIKYEAQLEYFEESLMVLTHQLEEESLRNIRCVCEARDTSVKKIRLGKLGLLKERFQEKMKGDGVWDLHETDNEDEILVLKNSARIGTCSNFCPNIHSENGTDGQILACNCSALFRGHHGQIIPGEECECLKKIKKIDGENVEENTDESETISNFKSLCRYQESQILSLHIEIGVLKNQSEILKRQLRGNSDALTPAEEILKRGEGSENGYDSISSPKYNVEPRVIVVRRDLSPQKNESEEEWWGRVGGKNIRELENSFEDLQTRYLTLIQDYNGVTAQLAENQIEKNSIFEELEILKQKLEGDGSIQLKEEVSSTIEISTQTDFRPEIKKLLVDSVCQTEERKIEGGERKIEGGEGGETSIQILREALAEALNSKEDFLRTMAVCGNASKIAKECQEEQLKKARKEIKQLVGMDLLNQKEISKLSAELAAERKNLLKYKAHKCFHLETHIDEVESLRQKLGSLEREMELHRQARADAERRLAGNDAKWKLKLLELDARQR